MRETLVIRCFDDRRIREITQVTSLTATDASGQFGLLPGHAPLLTMLLPGMVSYRQQNKEGYMGTAGGMLYCRDGYIQIVSTRFVEAANMSALMPALQLLQQVEQQDRQGRQMHSQDLMRTFTRRLKEWQELK